MNKTFSPASLISIAGGFLAVIGLISYFSNAANLSVPTFFYGVPILLIGLALKNSELSPANCNNSPSEIKQIKPKIPNELQSLLDDVTRFRYGQRAHLESSLQALKLWNEEKPPQLKTIKLLEKEAGYGVEMRFETNGVPMEKWEEKKDRLGRFFAKDLKATITSVKAGEIELTLLSGVSPSQIIKNNETE